MEANSTWPQRLLPHCTARLPLRCAQYGRCGLLLLMLARPNPNLGEPKRRPGLQPLHFLPQRQDPKAAPHPNRLRVVALEPEPSGRVIAAPGVYHMR